MIRIRMGLMYLSDTVNKLEYSIIVYNIITNNYGDLIGFNGHVLG